MQVKNNTAAPVTFAAQPARKAPVSAAPQTTVTFGGGKKKNEERSGLAGFFNLISRAFNRLVRSGHDREDEKLNDNPVPFLKEQHEKIKAKYEDYSNRLIRVNSRKEVATEELADLAKAEEKEKREAVRAMEFAEAEQAKLDKGESDKTAEFVGQLQKAAVNEANEWKDAKGRREAKEEILRGLELEAQEALQKLDELEEEKQSTLRQLEDAIELHKNNEAQAELIAIKKEVAAINTGEITYGESVSGVINEIKLRAKDNEYKLSEGKTREERQADLALRHATRQAEAQEAFDELKAELKDEGEQKDA